MREQSARVGVRSSGSFASSPPISSSDNPIRCAKTINAMRRSTARGYRRCPPRARREAIRPRSSSYLSADEATPLRRETAWIESWDSTNTVEAYIGIGGSLAAPPLPHHRAYGSVHGGSADYAVWAWAREARRRVLRKSSLGSAMASAGLLLIRQGPWALPAVCAARSRPTPLRRNSA